CPGTQREYTSAVSMKLPPASTYASSTASDAFWSVVQPNVLPPRHSADTRRPVLPNRRNSMQSSPLRYSSVFAASLDCHAVGIERPRHPAKVPHREAYAQQRPTPTNAGQ